MTPDELQKAVRRRLFAALTAVLLGGLLVAVGTAFIFWPAGLIIAGILLVIVGAWVVDIPDRPKRNRGGGV